MKYNKHTIGIQICAYYFIALGIINLRNFEKIGYLAYILATICISVGIGIFKYHKISRIVAMILPFLATAFYSYFAYLLIITYTNDTIQERMLIGGAESKAIFNFIIGIAILIFLNRPKVKELFKK